jgi:hypothetical protein
MILAGGAAFSMWGFVLARDSPKSMSDLYPIYNHARVLIEHQDPYIESAPTYDRLLSEGFLDSHSIAVYGLPIVPCVYPPTSLLLLTPLAMLHWGPAHFIWMGLIVSSLIIGSILIWTVTLDQAPLISAVLIGFVLINSESVLFEGNAAGVAVALCIVAVWSFVQERVVLLGSICLAISLALKPHDSALVWLCFLLCGTAYRKRALQSLLYVSVLAAVAVGWVRLVSPHWPRELASNVAALSLRGGVNDPGPHSSTGLIVNSAINLQTVFAVIWDKPAFYNFASYALCGLLFVFWLIRTIRSPMSIFRMWMSLAFISALSMLPIYHRHHDAKLLILGVPACALLWSRHRASGMVAFLVTGLAITMNADVPRAILTNLESTMSFSDTTIFGKVLTILLARPAPLAILAMAIFYLWVYWRRFGEADACLPSRAGQ